MMKKFWHMVLALLPAGGLLGSCNTAPETIDTEVRLELDNPPPPEENNYSPADYKDYVVIDADTPERQAQLELVVGQIHSTEEGLAVLKQALKLCERPIRIYVDNEGPSRFIASDDVVYGGTISLNFYNNRAWNYSDEQGNLHPHSLQRLVFHELLHAADEGRIGVNLHEMDELAAYQHIAERHNLMRPIVNAFMATHFGEVPRTLKHGLDNMSRDGEINVHKSIKPCSEATHVSGAALDKISKTFGL